MRVAAIIVAALTFSVPSFAAYRVAAWIPPWDANALSSIQSNVGTLTESNPVWYAWNADTTIAKNWNAENPTWRAAMTGSALLPTIQNVVNHSFDATAVQTMLSTAANREAHASAILLLVTSNSFDGIDVDYERIPYASRANFTAFLTTLASKLHGAGKKLSVSVYAKTSDVNWNGEGGEDWSAIGGLADTVKIMAYDYHWATSDAGDVTPLSWLDAVATYAQSAIPASKIIMGLPWYGYDWSATGTGSGVTYASATQTALNNGATITHDADGEATFTYGSHVVYFNDATSYAAQINLLKTKHGGIGGFTHWAAGNEDPAVWNLLRGGTSTTTPPPPSTNPGTPAPSDFTVSGPASLSVTQGSSTAGDFHLIPINNFAGTASVAVVPASFAGSLALTTPTVNASSTVTLLVRTTASTLPGAYTITLRFTSGTIVHDVPFTLTVTAVPAHRRAAGH